MPLASRYSSGAIYLPIALVNLVPMICADLSKRMPVLVGRLWAMPNPLLGSALLIVHVMSLAPSLRIADAVGTDRRRGKAALLLIDVLPDNQQLSEMVNPDPILCAASATELNAMGYLHPPLIRSRNILDIADPNPAPPPHGKFGAVERAGDSGPENASFVGWAILPQYHHAADAVVLTYQNPNDQPIIFRLARMGLERPDITVAYGDSSYQFAGWVATFPMSLLPAEAKPARIAAWAIDSETGRAYHLDGDIHIQR
jgi:hypothetical protein